MNDTVYLVGFFCAIAIGFWLGRRDKRKKVRKSKERLSKEYFIGLNYLLNEQTNEAIDTFIKALETNPDSQETFDTCIALGRLFCKRGEVDRAIRVHQSLLARPSLTKKQSLMVQLELSRDYYSAGLLDRSEGLLTQLVEVNAGFQVEALELLLAIYQQEKEWLLAIEIGKKLLKNNVVSYSNLVAHFYCELAEEQVAKSNTTEGREYLKQALKYNKQCVRASLVLGKLEYSQGNLKESLKALQKIYNQDPNYISESVPLLEELRLEQSGSVQKSVNSYLQKCLKDYPSVAIVLSLAKEIEMKQGAKDAGKFIAEQLARRPSLRGLNQLIDIHIGIAEGKSKKNLGLLRELTRKLSDGKPLYRCINCGFSGQELHWQCPSCQHWGEVKPIHGVEGQ
ncbi:lipopolysaccharide assembly protein LapB [Spartinivicinus poritis]|uniref:Lipopolysaccharide assembly protein B n=1 Tax=Spartinivicinus poritis TaxID=2994640 RepID=A0ABT5U7D7_9GAMM|nr:lipopolysaccharide assembly protein LapB [Spartinivicinus sp. A2-2]MDE1462292.1 lipopolysaccharide assembly protein LapB [Spartinivicinus sp. A2-2]